MYHVNIPTGSTQWDTPTMPLPADQHDRQPPTEKPKCFPLEVFPHDLRQFIERCADDLNYEPDFLAGSILAAASGAIGRSYTLHVRPGWIEAGVLWLCIVGRPGSGKSHPMKSALTPIFRRDIQLYVEYQEAKQAYDEYKSLPKADKENTPEVSEPILQKHTVSDITLEALANVLRNSDVLLHADEFRGWLANFNRYTPGSDTERFGAAVI